MYTECLISYAIIDKDSFLTTFKVVYLLRPHTYHKQVMTAWMM